MDRDGLYSKEELELMNYLENHMDGYIKGRREGKKEFIKQLKNYYSDGVSFEKAIELLEKDSELND